jgi:hypothetical protein
MSSVIESDRITYGVEELTINFEKQTFSVVLGKHVKNRIEGTFKPQAVVFGGTVQVTVLISPEIIGNPLALVGAAGIVVQNRIGEELANHIKKLMPNITVL